MDVVAFRGGRDEALRVVRAMLATLTGQNRTEDARGVFLAIGMAALSDIHADFIRKARGGVGEDGNTWPRLSPKTLAYSRRFGPGEQAQLKRDAGLGRENRFAPGGNKGLLTESELKQWRGIFASRLARFAASMPLGEAKAKAAAIAWAEMKSRGAKTKLEVFGYREHEALRDTGVLSNSLSVGSLVGLAYILPGVPGGDQQIFDILSNGVIVGTSVAYAKAHNEGIKVPKRQFIPKDDAVPQIWLDRWLDAGMRALAFALGSSLQRGAF
jgi:hypothetical protein